MIGSTAMRDESYRPSFWSAICTTGGAARMCADMLEHGGENAMEPGYAEWAPVYDELCQWSAAELDWLCAEPKIPAECA
jgi:hypothetical protein